MPELIINGKTESFDPLPESVLALMKAIGLDPDATLAEVDGEIVSRAAATMRKLEPGNKIELVRFVGGG
jgi:thiamine biosynthesis protein ThiS